MKEQIIYLLSLFIKVI